jgi:hypothetical protein
MAQGRKTGGRERGTPNRRSVELAERLEALDCDPVALLASIATDTEADMALRVKCSIELMAYLYPKRKAIEITEVEQEPDEVDYLYENLTDEELESLRSTLKAAEERMRNSVKPRSRLDG